VEDHEQAIGVLDRSADLVLLDLMLPRVDGFEVFRRLPPGVLGAFSVPGLSALVLTRSAKVSRRSGTSLGWPSRRQTKGGEEDEEAAMDVLTGALVTLALWCRRTPCRRRRCPGQELSALAISDFADADRENCWEE